jgi:TRAP-type uncharacterized transport system fused permease subunit
MTDPIQPKFNTPLVSSHGENRLVVAVSLSLYQLYTAGIATLTALVQRSIHLGPFWY